MRCGDDCGWSEDGAGCEAQLISQVPTPVLRVGRLWSSPLDGTLAKFLGGSMTGAELGGVSLWADAW
jgi:hypothetical protein